MATVLDLILDEKSLSSIRQFLGLNAIGGSFYPQHETPSSRNAKVKIGEKVKST